MIIDEKIKPIKMRFRFICYLKIKESNKKIIYIIIRLINRLNLNSKT